MQEAQGNEQQIVKNFILDKADDPASVDFSEWGPPLLVTLCKTRHNNWFPFGGFQTQDVEAKRSANSNPKGDMLGEYESGVVIYLKWRMKNKLGAKVRREGVFLVQDGKVTSALPVADGVTDVADAVGELDQIALERVEGKLTRAIVRGKVFLNGKPLKLANGAKDERLQVEFIPDDEGMRRGRFSGSSRRALTEPPRYEAFGLRPGKYRVSVEWMKLDLIGMVNSPGDRDKLSGAYSQKQTPLSLTVNENQEVQDFDLNLKGAVTEHRRGADE
jgi:hypothetical protein